MYLVGKLSVCLVCLCWVGCRHLLVPQNSRQPWDLKWSKSMGTWDWALLMCPGGPNHCRVGRTGSHSYFFRQLIVVHCFQMLDVHLRSLCCFRSFMCHVHRHIVTQCIMSLLPLYTRTHKTNFVLVMWGLLLWRNRRFVTLTDCCAYPCFLKKKLLL